MIDAPRLLKDLQRIVKELEEDLRERTSDQPELEARLREQYREARDAGRTGHAFEIWRDELLTQVAVAWVLGCVFVRFMEDNDLVETPRLSGPGERRQRALDQHELYFQDPTRRTHSDREYLEHVFAEMQKLPAARELFDDAHNPLWLAGISGDAATRLLEFWQRLSPETGALDHDFRDPSWNTRFLGDLYQDLSESARKRYALLQTPEFVEEFILDRSLTPAIETFGFQEVRLIDPTCGSGHFLLGAFERLFDLHVKHEPAANPRDLVQRALDQVHGVDLNPFAVSIARLRLLIAALQACGVKRLEDAPAFRIHLAVGDSLLHGRGLQGARQEYLDVEEDPLRHVYQTEDAQALKETLGQTYHVVVGNPPYITVKDKALNQAYRNTYSSCHRQYSLGVPFTQRFFELAQPGDTTQTAGFVGMITANSFMKREFGTKLIEELLPRLDLTHVIDTSGAYIPGHGTPTVILFGRNRPPVANEIRTAMGIRGEPETPEDPRQGQVWRSIVDQLDSPGSENEFVSVEDYARERFKEHPWSLGGGGAAEIKDTIETAAEKRLCDIAGEIGFVCMTRADDVYFTPRHALHNAGISDEFIVENVEGEVVRDWAVHTPNTTVFPYNDNLEPIEDVSKSPVIRFLWPYRSQLWLRREPNGNHKEIGLTWYEWSRFQRNRFRTPLSIAFAFVATHNHFVLDRGGKVFKQSAPVIKLPPGTSEKEHLALLALLNSSTGCFWMKQVFHNKGSTVDQKGARQTTVEFENFYEFTGTGLQEFPVPPRRPTDRARRLDELGAECRIVEDLAAPDETPSRDRIANYEKRAAVALATAISHQEELDWACYQAYDLIDEDLCYVGAEAPPIELGQRAFEIVLARKLVEGSFETTWFARHGSQPTTDLPDHWPADYQRLVERRIALIESDRSIALIEQPEYKRRWNTEPFEEAKQRSLHAWLLDRLETPTYWPSPELQSTARLADRASRDPDFMQVAELYAGHPDFDVAALVRDLVENESVPALSACRYKPAGLRKRARWERTWAQQREEDAIDAWTKLDPADPQHLSEAEAERLKAKEIGDIPVPPKYGSGDFQKTSYWRLRGKLDVPKERFVSFPHCEREADPSPVVGWAGWTTLEQAQATAAYYLQLKEQEGWTGERLVPLLGALLEMLPWLKQWHNEPDPASQIRMGDYFGEFVSEEARALGQSVGEIESWTPPAKTRARKPRKKAARKKKDPEAHSA